LTRTEVDEAIGILDRVLGDVETGKFDIKKIDAFAGW
jgi:hypothetical protein